MPIEITRAVLRRGYAYCLHCEGKGCRSKYDEGWRSLAHSPELAAPRTCGWCNGTGLRKI